VKLLWLELKKIAVSTARHGAAISLVLVLLASGTGTSMIFDAPTQVSSGLSGTRILHMQLFGGFVHLHNMPGIDAHSAVKNVPNGVYETVESGRKIQTLDLITATNVVNSNTGEMIFSIITNPKLQPAKGLEAISFDGPLSRHLNFDLVSPSQFQPVVPLRPPVM
jgi:hypothetical protein